MRIKNDKDSLIRYLLIAGIILVSGAAFAVFYEQVIPYMGSILRFVGALILPFAIAWLASVITKPLNRLLTQKLHFPRTIAVLLVMLIFFAVVTCIIVLFISVLTNVLAFLVDHISSLDVHTDDISAFISNIYNKLGLDSQKIVDFLSGFKDEIGKIASQGLGIVVNVAKATPGAVVLIFVTLVAVFYWCRDEEKVVPVLCNALPKRYRRHGLETYNNFSSIVGKYIRAQLIMISITFAICTIGFLILKTPSPLALGLFVAVLDIIPVLGPGTILIPWFVWCFVAGDVGMGIALLLLYCIVSAARYMLEPKIVGDSVGLHPLAALAAVFIGMRLFGIMGLILGPIALAVIMGTYRRRKNMQEVDAVREDWNKDDEPQAERPKKNKAQEEKPE